MIYINIINIVDKKNKKCFFLKNKKLIKDVENWEKMENLKLLDQVCFVPMRRQEHEVPAMLGEILRQAKLQPEPQFMRVAKRAKRAKPKLRQQALTDSWPVVGRPPRRCGVVYGKAGAGRRSTVSFLVQLISVWYLFGAAEPGRGRLPGSLRRILSTRMPNVFFNETDRIEVASVRPRGGPRNNFER